MMNDRFSVELRQHLLAAADERPGEGRLDAIVAGVAVTAQRRRLVPRLPWSPARRNPFPSRALRYGLVAAALLVAIVAAALFAAGGFQSRTVFTGTWTSTDPGDGSSQTLVIGAGANPTVRFQDEIATGGACNNDPTKVFTADGTGAITDDHLATSFPEGGGCGGMTVDVSLQFAYVAATDSLRDQDGVDWVRVRSDRPAVPSPTTAPSVATPEPSDTCVQFDAPAVYTAPAGSMSLSVDVPGTAQEPWLAQQGQFHLLRAACTDMSGQGYIEAREVTRVYTDGCAGTSVPVSTTAEAIAAVAAAKGLGVVGQSGVTLGGYQGTRFDIRVPQGLITCPDHQLPVVAGLNPFDEEVSYALYLIDVDGKTLAVALFGYMDWAPAVTTAVEGILASMQIDPTAPTPDPTVTPSTSPTTAPTPHAGEATFTSAVNGFSMGVPAGWQSRPATEPWRGEALGFESAAADVIYDPALGDQLYVVVASRSFSRMSADAWSEQVYSWTCPEGAHEGGSWKVDGAGGWVSGPCNAGLTVETDTRGYLFRLVASTDVADTYDWDWLKKVLETVDLRPRDAVDAAGAGVPISRCSEIAAGDTYTNRYGSPKLSATVPAGAKSTWLGYRDGFDIGSDCQYGRPVWISARTVDAVQGPNACDAGEPDVSVQTAGEAADAITAHQGHTTSARTDLRIDGRRAIRLELSGEGSTCDDGIKVWPFDEFLPEGNQIVYLVDMNGSVLGISLSYIRDQTTPAQLAEAEAIAESIQAD